MSEGSGPGTTSPRTAPPVTVLVMRQDEAAADSALRPGLAGSEAAADAEDEAGEDDADLLDTSDPAGGGESAASPEELEDEDAEGGGAARRRGSKTCTYEGCRETTSQVAKQRKPWMCKKHRNKMYKDKYKKKKSDQAQGSGGPAAASTGNVKLEKSWIGSGVVTHRALWRYLIQVKHGKIEASVLCSWDSAAGCVDLGPFSSRLNRLPHLLALK